MGGVVTNLEGTAKHTNHEHHYREIVCEDIPPWLEHSQSWLLICKLSELCHRNHDACWDRLQKRTILLSVHITVLGMGGVKHRLESVDLYRSILILYNIGDIKLMLGILLSKWIAYCLY